jgi:hypothetical protein
MTFMKADKHQINMAIETGQASVGVSVLACQLEGSFTFPPLKLPLRTNDEISTPPSETAPQFRELCACLIIPAIRIYDPCPPPGLLAPLQLDCVYVCGTSNLSIRVRQDSPGWY